MSTGRSWITSILICCGLSAGCAMPDYRVAIPAPEEAWWLTREFKATGHAVYGVPVEGIDPQWKSATILDTAYCKRVLSDAQFRQVEASPLKLSVSMPSNGRDTQEKAFVGVYETLSGDAGRFITIVSNGRLMAHFTDAGFAGYSAMLQQGDELLWYKCMDCSDYDVIRWVDGKYVLE